MLNFYTNVQVRGSKILYRGVENGRRVCHKLDYSPSLFVPSDDPTPYQTIHGDYVAKINPGNIQDAREFVKQYEGVDNFPIYGNNRYEYTYISDNFPGTVNWDRNHIRVCNIDIEVGSENGFPEPATATEPITAITYKTNNQFVVFGCDDFFNSRKDVKYIKCQDELDLINRFMTEFTRDYPDVITGWNVKFFDILYLINRMKNILGEKFANKLSPWGYLTERTVILMGREHLVYVPSGVAVLDYMELYRKFAPHGMSQESYKLDNICNVEIGEKKLSYDEYGSLHNLYKEDYQKFIEYNIRDVELVDKLDAKLKLIDLALTLSYDSKSNYDDVFAQVRMWDAIIYNKLKANKVVVPPNTKHVKKEAYVGAYVKDPIIGMHKWVASFDLTSLYPHLIMQYSISPDSIVTKERILERINQLKKSLSNST